MVDDEKSIYVGGIPYDSTEDSLRCVFDLYGAVTAIKIINDKKVGGKCYAFVTFSNPRSSQDAIMDMNGRTIGGRIVRVSEVRTRTNNHSDSYHENFSRGTSRDRERPNYGVRGPYRYNKYRDRSLSRSHVRSRESSFDQPSDRGWDEDRPSDRGRKSDQLSDRGWDEDQPLERRRKRDRPLDRYSDRDGDEYWASDDDANKDRNEPQGGRLKGHESGEMPSHPHDDRLDELRGLLEKRIEKHDDLQRKVDFLKDKIDEKKHDISDLQNKSQKLEDGMIAAQKLTSQRKLLLSKLHRCFVQFQNYTEKIKVSGEELETLVNDAMMETYTDEGRVGTANNVSPFVNGPL